MEQLTVIYSIHSDITLTLAHDGSLYRTICGPDLQDETKNLTQAAVSTISARPVDIFTERGRCILWRYDPGTSFFQATAMAE